MRRPNTYVDLDGNEICLEHLDADERKLLGQIRRRARTHPDWDDFDNYWTRAIPAFYEARRLEPRAVARTSLWRIAGDLSGRIAIASGLARKSDYRDDLEELIGNYPTQKAFCEATGLSQDMLCHFLAGRKDLSLKALTKALDRIGYGLHIRPRCLEAHHPAKAASRKRTG
jgi:hypothetical protein